MGILPTVFFAAAFAGLTGCGTLPPRAAAVPPYTPAVEALDVRVALSDSPPPAPAGTGPSVFDAEEPAIRTLLPGDRLVVTLRMYPRTETFECVIDENGTINLDLVGRVMVGGMTSAAAEKVIETAYKDGQFYKTITAAIIPPVREFFVKGYVLRQGNYPINRTKMTLLQALTTAGGWNEFADPSKIRLIRGEEIMILNVLKIQARTEPDVYIEPGDVIDVPKRWM